MASRREAREQAFVLVFEMLFNSEDISVILELASEALDAELDDYARDIAKGVFEHSDELDDIISRFCIGRSISRLSKTVLAILRLSVYEIKYVDSIDTPVSINEAVELAKKFSGDEEAGYINGVLGSFVRSGEI